MTRSRRCTAERVVAALTIAIALAPLEAAAGAWVRPPGHVLVIAQGGYSVIFDPQFAADPVAQSYTTFNLFAEIGLPWRSDLLIQLPYVIAERHYFEEARYTNHSFGDAHVQLDHGLFEALNLSVALDAKIPLYRPVSGYSADGVLTIGSNTFLAGNFPDVGNGVFELTPKILFGHGFSARPVWLLADVGFRARWNGLQHGAYGSLEIGLWAWPTHLALAAYGNVAFELPMQPSTVFPAGQPFAYTAYAAFKLIATAAPWLPWLKLFGQVGGVLMQSKNLGGWDAQGGLGVEY